MKKIFIGLLFCWIGQACAEPSAVISLSSIDVEIPTPIVIKAALHYPDTYTPDFDAMRRNLTQNQPLLLASFKLTKAEINPPEVSEGGFLNQTALYTLEPLREGEIPVSLLNIPFISKDAKNAPPVEIFTDVFTVHVTPPEALDKDPSTIGYPAPPLPLTPDIPISLSLANRQALIDNPALLAQEAIRNTRIVSQRSFPWSLLAALVLACAAFMLWKRWRLHQRELEAKRRQITPQQQASNDLMKLEKRGFQGAEQEFYQKLSDIVRIYIQDALHVNIIGETTEEFLSEASEEMRNRVDNLLHKADLVKFAHYRPSKQECEEALASAKALIKPRG